VGGIEGLDISLRIEGEERTYNHPVVALKHHYSEQLARGFPQYREFDSGLTADSYLSSMRLHSVADHIYVIRERALGAQRAELMTLVYS
jgi:hypothetical protein